MKNILVAAALATAVAATTIVPALASAFWGGTVIGVASSDVLHLRNWPSASSVSIYQYNNGDPISLIKRCKNTVTNVSFFINGSQSAAWKHNKMKQPYVWCQVMSPNAQLGWVRGKYVWPN